MGGVNVKITMIERVLQIIAPHPCSGCGKMGAILCEDCKYDIIHEPFLGCILCGTPQKDGICSLHASSIQRAFTVGLRTGALEDVINRLKFHNTKAAGYTLGGLLDDALPILPRGIYIVPIPTVTSHIRQRGYDQVEVIVRQFATLRNLPIKRFLKRATKDTQHVVGKSTRQKQSAKAFALRPGARVKGANILLIDDVVTTGSTLSAAADILSKAGATVWVAALAYQPLD
jgi:ComF family protein